MFLVFNTLRFEHMYRTRRIILNKKANGYSDMICGYVLRKYTFLEFIQNLYSLIIQYISIKNLYVFIKAWFFYLINENTIINRNILLSGIAIASFKPLKRLLSTYRDLHRYCNTSL